MFASMIFEVALSLTPGVSPGVAQKLISKLFTAENIFAQSYSTLIESGASPRVAEAILQRVAFPRAESQIEHANKHNIEIIPLTSERYPYLLRKSPKPPFVIYVMGDAEVLNRNLITMVGTRHSTYYAARACNLIVRGMAETLYNPVVVSGLASGVDTAAHQAALDNNIPTVAVLASPLPKITPASNKALANKILQEGGAIISDFAFDSVTHRNSFVSRNKIVAGLSSMTVIVESMKSGGSMHTANMTVDMNRPLGAVPGCIHEEASEGSNYLLASGMACAITSVDDIIRRLGWNDKRLDSMPFVRLSDVVPAPRAEGSRYSEEQLTLLRAMRSQPMHISEIETLTKMRIGELMAALMELEILDAIKVHSGSRYEKLIKC